MSPIALGTLVARWRVLCLPRSKESDGELLERFAQHADAVAFEQLVQRHASLVWRVCRRILVREADCEDAFQATFLSLVRQARLLDARQPLEGWLHTVAVRVAHKARVRSLKQRAWAVPPDRSMPDVVDDVSSRELLHIVDVEIARLPDKLRVAVVLCCLEGRTRDEAAEAIGCSVAAVKSRLERGRGLLRRRLEQHGIQVPVAFLVLTMTGGRVSASLRAKAVQSALTSAPPAVAALVPTTAVPLAGKLAWSALSLLAAGMMGIGVLRFAEAGLAQNTRVLPADPPIIAPLAVAEGARPALDHFGDPLPPGAVRRFGTLRFRQSHIENVAFTPDGKQLIAGSGRTSLAVFDPATGRKLRDVGKPSPNNFGWFALSPDGKRAACCGFDVKLWDLETGELIRELGCGRCQSVAFSPDGTKVATVKDLQAELQIVEAASGKRLAGWTVGQGGQIGQGGQVVFDVRSLAFTPDGKLLAGLVSEMREDKPFQHTAVSSQVRLWDVENGAQAGAFGSAKNEIFSFAFEPGTKRLATLGKDGAIRFWEVGTGKEVRHFSVKTTIKADTLHALVFSGDGQLCALYDRNGFLIVLDAKQGKELRRLQVDLPESTSPVALALSPDGGTVAFGKFYGQSCVRVWDVKSGAERLPEAGHRSAATVSLTAEGRALVSRGEDGQVFHWDLRTGEAAIRPADGRTQVGRFSRTPAGWSTSGPRWEFRLATPTSEMEVWSLDGSKLIRKAKEPSNRLGFTLSPDGTYLAFGLQEPGYPVLLWNPEQEEEPRKLPGHPDNCNRLLFSHDGKRLIVGAGGHNSYPSETICIWDVATARVVRKLDTHNAPGQMLLTADDRVLITGGAWNDAAVNAWDLETGKQLATLADPVLKVTSEERDKVQSPPAISGLVLSADERFLAVVTNQRNATSLSIWDVGSWKLVRAFAPTQPQSSAHSIVFSRDGRSAFVANNDSTILEWDVSGRHGKPQTEVPSPARLDAMWHALREPPDKAYPAVWEMVDHSAEAVRFLKGHITPGKPADSKRLRLLLNELDSQSFEAREEASRQLLAAGEQAVPVLRLALENRPSPEVTGRVERILDALMRTPSPEQLRLLRAVAVLEWSGLAEAHDYLREFAGGDPSNSLTRAAKAALQRRREAIIPLPSVSPHPGR